MIRNSGSLCVKGVKVSSSVATGTCFHLALTPTVRDNAVTTESCRQRRWQHLCSHWNKQLIFMSPSLLGIEK